jgi:Protein of unknown function (DUF2398)/Protein of unknown function C-terminus (DUF2399)
MTAPLADVLDRQQVEERRRALRALLRHPLLTRAGPDPAAFALVRRHAGWLREWLAANVGWSLQVDTGLARLRKLPGRLGDRTRPALAEPAALPWRQDADAYRSAADKDGPPLRGRPVTATWDPALTQAILELGVKVEEEQVLDDLLADLANPEHAVQ